MNMLFEFMSMVLNNHMLKVDLSIFLKNASRLFLLFKLSEETK
jgi:hypothetical protein